MSKVRVGTFMGRPPSPQITCVLPKVVMKKQRSDLYLEGQVKKVQEAKLCLENARKKMRQTASSEQGKHQYRKHVKMLERKYDRTVIVLTAAQKLATELDFSRRALRENVTSKDRHLIQMRIRWLEERLRVLLKDHEMVNDSHSPAESNSLADDDSSKGDRSADCYSDKEQDGVVRDVSVPSENETKATVIAKSVDGVVPNGRTVGTSADDAANKQVFLTETSWDRDSNHSADAEQQPAGGSPQLQNDVVADGDGDEYWNKEHHRVTYSSLRHVDSLFYHKIALCVQETYVDEDQIIGELPYERGRRSSNLSDDNIRALNDLSKSVGQLYDRVREASKLSINIGVDSFPETEHCSQGSDTADVAKNSITRVQSTSSTSQSTTPRRRKLSPIKAVVLPTARTQSDVTFPRSSENFSSSVPGRQSAATRIFDQRDLLEETSAMLSLFKSKKGVRIKTKSVQSRFSQMLKEDADEKRRLLADKPRMQEQADEEVRADALKWSRIEDLLCTVEASSRSDDRLDAVRQLGALNCSHSSIIETLEKVLEEEVEEQVIYETAKSLVKLGRWTEAVLQQLIHYLLVGSRQAKNDLIVAMVQGRPVSSENKKLPTYSDLCRIVSLMSHNSDCGDLLSFNAAVCLYSTLDAESDDRADAKLTAIVLSSTNVHHKAKALELLVNRTTEYDTALVSSAIHQLRESPVWTLRRAAAQHLIRFGNFPRKPALSTYDVYNSLMRSLMNDVNALVRLEAAKALASYGLISRTCEDVDRMLFDETSDKARSSAVIAIGTLGLKTERVLKALFDMAELDVSHNVRLLVIRTFGQLNCSDSRVLLLLERCSLSSEERLARASGNALPVMEL